MRHAALARAVGENSGTWHAGVEIPGFPEHAVSVQYATEHRCGVVVRGAGLSDAISGTDPLKDNLPLQVSALKFLKGT